MSAKKARARLFITERALRDLAEIENYSATEWGNSVAARSIEDIQAALLRIQDMPDLLRPEEGFHAGLAFYRVKKHLLVCDRQATDIFLLTVIHASRDIPSRLAELAPTLAAETQLLREQLLQREHRKVQ